MSNYPLGMPGPQGTELELSCANEDCGEFLYVVTVYGTKEFGMVYLNNEDKSLCHECDKEMYDPMDSDKHERHLFPPDNGDEGWADDSRRDSDCPVCQDKDRYKSD